MYIQHCGVREDSTRDLAYYVHPHPPQPLLYARYHKLHHSFTAPIAFTGLYASPVEHFFADLLPTVLPLAIVAHLYEPVHIIFFNTVLMGVLLASTAKYSGYDFAQSPLPKAHSLHHEKFNVNLWLSALHGLRCTEQIDS